MKIEILGQRADRFREVRFYNFEDEEIVADSGLLDAGEAMEFAGRLREVAHQLATWAQESRPNDGQILLPMFSGVAA
jgi:hypothetical protein